MEKIFENFTFSVLKLNKLISKIKTVEMRKYGLKAIHVMCVYYINTSARPLTQAELCKLTLENKAAISRGVAELKEKGYLTYDADGYNAEIRLTEEGKKLATIVDEKSEAAVNASCAAFTDEERKTFYAALNAIADNLNDYYNKIIKENPKNEN